MMLELGSEGNVEAFQMESEGMCKGPVARGACLRNLRETGILECRLRGRSVSIAVAVCVLFLKVCNP